MNATLPTRFLAALLIVLPQPLQPATIMVNGQTGDSPGTCDLVEAIENANNDTGTNADCSAVGPYGSDSIELQVDVNLDTVDNMDDGASGLPTITSTIEIWGNGLSIRRDPGAADFRLFSVASGGDLTLQDTTLSGGKEGAGGGIKISYGDVTLENSTLAGNSASEGGGIFSLYGNALLKNSTLAGNTATNGGGIFNFNGSVVLTASTVSGNSVTSRGGGITTINNTGTVNGTDSVISRNTAAVGGGGIYSQTGGVVTLAKSILVDNSAPLGGGILTTWGGEITLTNCTLSGNSADTGGGIYDAFYGTTSLTNTTLAGNSASIGGGIYNYASASTSLANTVLANGPDANCAGTITDGGNNLASDTSCGAGVGTLTGLDRKLADNGGPTRTHALLTGSSAIDLAGACSTATDQRGAGREGDCDSGSFEFLACPDLVLGNEIVAGTETRTNCQRILVGPAFTVANSGDLTLRAGSSIEIGDGTTVETDGLLTLALDADLQISKTASLPSAAYPTCDSPTTLDCFEY